ncbi:MAG: hypothetical protein ABIN96_12450 [Rubrivivax sp.]
MHSARSRRWRQREVQARGQAEQNVTHQGSQAQVVDAPLLAWTHDIASVAADAQDSAALPGDPTEQAQPCHRCAAPLGRWVRQGFLRHGLRGAMLSGRRHDHCP